jgi:hypothetical protein
VKPSSLTWPQGQVSRGAAPRLLCRRCLVLAFAPLLLTTTLLRPAIAAPPSPAELLERYRAAAVARDVPRIFKGQTISQIMDLPAPGRSIWVRNSFEFRTDGKRVEVLNNNGRVEDEAKLATMQLPMFQQVLWDGQTSYEFQGNEKAPQSGAIQFTRDPNDRQRKLALGNPSAPLDGMLPGDIRPLHEILAQASKLVVRDADERIGDSVCHVLEATTPVGHYKLWIDPQRDHQVARAELRQGPGDQYYGDVVAASGGNNAASSSSAVREHDFVFENVRFAQVGGKWVVTQADTQRSSKSAADAKPFRSRQHHSRSDFNFTPDFAAMKAFVLRAPDGTRAASKDLPNGLPLIWQGGRLIPKLDDQVVARIDAVAAGLRDATRAGGASVAAASSAPASQVKLPTPLAQNLRGNAAGAAAPTRGNYNLALIAVGVLLAMAAAALLIISRRGGRRAA